MLTSYEITILTIASCSAGRGSDVDGFVPPPSELTRLVQGGMLRVVSGTRCVIDPMTGRAAGYTDRWYESTPAGDRVVERARHGSYLSAEARRLLDLVPVSS